MPTVAAFIKEEMKNPRVSQSVRKCAENISAQSIHGIISQAQEFCNRLAPVRDALNQVSDLVGILMVTAVWPMIQKLTRIREGETGYSPLRQALVNHLSRLKNKHNMKFWDDIMWFAPDFISLRARKAGFTPLSVERTNDLFRGETPIFHISEHEWKSYLFCTDYEWDPSRQRTEMNWWDTIGIHKFPSVYEAAKLPQVPMGPPSSNKM